MTESTYNHIAGGAVPIKAWTKGVPVEDSALEQLRNLSEMPFIHKHVAVMPDVHWGMGSTIGSVIPTRGAIIPAAVGVDIGCGMCAVRTNLSANDLPDNLSGVRSEIEAAVPHGRSNHGKPGDVGAWAEPHEGVVEAFRPLSGGVRNLIDRHPKLLRTGTVDQRAMNHLGTLGTGNHFIEVCLDENDAVWVMLHSGSRGIGNAIGMYFIKLAKEDMRKWFVNLPDDDLAYLPEGTDHFDDYIEGVSWAQIYARTNREVMLSAALLALGKALDRTIHTDEEAVNCHHNYVGEGKPFRSQRLANPQGGRARA